MNNRIHFLPLAAAVLAITLAPLRAQVPDGSSATFNNTTNTFANITIGTNGSFTLLTLANNALFTNSGNCVIGLNATARSNEVRLISPTARWLMNGTLHVGSNGAANRLVVSNGATIRNNGVGYLGLSVSSSNNVALITGTGSLWTNGNALVLGDNGMGNQLVISNGGVVRAASAFVSLGLSSNNLMTVTGPGSVWNSSGDLRFGYSGAGNQLLISDGGLVQDATGTLGSNPTGRNNSALVTGSGSTWNNQLNLVVGLDGSGNQLVVSNAGTVVNQTGYIGGGATSRSNSVMVVGTNSLWNLSQGVLVGTSGQNNQLLVGAGGVVSAVSFGNIGAAVNATGNSATVAEPGARWSMGAGLDVGSNGALSRLVISNGGLVVNTLGTVGHNISSSNNVVVVTGAGSAWSNSSSLYFGYDGRGNQLLISDGAKVRDSLSYVGIDASSSNNLVVVNGPGSAWYHAFELYFGLGSGGNQLVVSNGGAILDTIGVLGSAIDGNSNGALVTGPGSIWSNVFELYVGSEGTGNQLTVSNGGVLKNSIGTVGYLADSNVVLVTDIGSLWTNSLNLVIGNMASRNQMVVSNGAAVVAAGNGFIGYDTGANSNAATLTGAGSRWLLSSNLYVGSNGALNRLIITNGARVENGTGTIGQTATSSSNLAMVTGVGSWWSNRGDLFVGFNGAGNQLVVSNGGAVRNATGEIGRNSTSNNLAWVTGAGSVWENTNQLLIGRSGSFNQLVVSNGGLVSSLFAHFSISSSASSNSVLVIGAGSAWSNAFGIYLGLSGRGNRLDVRQGGLVQDRESFLGFDSNGSSSNNLAVVADPGSLWTNVSDLGIGYFGTGNQLVVSNGGTVFAGSTVLLGVFPSSTNNRIEINNGSLLVSNAFGAGMLDIRRGTNVLNAGLIDVQRLLVTNDSGFFEFNGGAVRTSGTTNSNGRIFTVGNGTSAATFQLHGGTHSFANNLSVANKGTLTGNGTVIGTVNLLPGSTLSPGTSVGKLILNSSPVLQGVTLMEISRNAAALTNDQIQVAGAITYGGSLTVTNIGPTALAAGDRFQLFSAGNYAGAFASISLPSLGFNLSWTNKLAVDGSIEVVGGPVPEFTGISRVGTNLIISGTGGVSNATFTVLTATNAAQSVSEWTSIATNQFGSGGNFSFTNGIDPGTPQRFFRLRWP